MTSKELNASSWPKEKILSELKAKKDLDVDWKSGKVFGYVFHVNEEADRVIEEAHRMFMWENALDPRLFNSLLKLEQEVVGMVAGNLSSPEMSKQIVGNMTTGGTESVLLAVKTARDWARARDKNSSKKYNFIVGATAHAAFHKAAHYFDLEIRVVDVDSKTASINPEEIKKVMDKNTILLVASAPSYAHGTIDPVSQIAALAIENNILCHVDACVGGWLLPFMKKAGFEISDFDFNVPGVTSISVDLHKYAFAAKGASVVLYKNSDLRFHQIFTCASWSGYAMINPTMLSTKSGGPIAGAWAALRHFGEEGYLKVAKDLRSKTLWLVDEINQTKDFYVIGSPGMSLIAIGSKSINLFKLCDALSERGWEAQPQQRRGGVEESVHLTIMPHSLEHLDSFMKDLLEVAPSCRNSFSLKKITTKGVAQMAGDDISPFLIEQILNQVGVKMGELPNGPMSEVNEAINEFSPKLVNKILQAYANKLF
jgi:sphinganine-1-phosphate aldolase